MALNGKTAKANSNSDSHMKTSNFYCTIHEAAANIIIQ